MTENPEPDEEYKPLEVKIVSAKEEPYEDSGDPVLDEEDMYDNETQRKEDKLDGT